MNNSYDNYSNFHGYDDFSIEEEEQDILDAQETVSFDGIDNGISIL